MNFDKTKILRTKYGILPLTNEIMTQPVTWQDQPNTAVIQLLFKLGGRVPYLGRYVSGGWCWDWLDTIGFTFIEAPKSLLYNFKGAPNFQCGDCLFTSESDVYTDVRF